MENVNNKHNLSSHKVDFVFVCLCKNISHSSLLLNQYRKYVLQRICERFQNKIAGGEDLEMEHVGSQNGNIFKENSLLQMAQETERALIQYNDVLGIFWRRSEEWLLFVYALCSAMLPSASIDLCIQFTIPVSQPLIFAVRPKVNVELEEVIWLPSLRLLQPPSPQPSYHLQLQ